MTFVVSTKNTLKRHFVDTLLLSGFKGNDRFRKIKLVVTVRNLAILNDKKRNEV